ncbi:MAG: nitroreductase family protein [Deltaproteobacteria bacterium]|nr:nitroreductase family protein [Deltaproteobacteria bacterium]
MNFYEVIKTRRSVRSFKPDPIPDAVLQHVLNAARIAPSGGNRQPTRFILTRDEQRKKQLVPLCNGQSFISQAPVVVTACGQDIRGNRGGYMGKLSMLVDVAVAFDHLTLAARAEGLGTCWIGSFDNAGIKQFLKIPDDFQVVALTPLGYPEGDPFIETTDRLPLDQLVCEEEWHL